MGAGAGAAAGVAAAYGGGYIVLFGGAVGTSVGATIGGEAGGVIGSGIGSGAGVAAAGAITGAAGAALTDLAISNIAGGQTDIVVDIKSGLLIGFFAPIMPEAGAIGYARGVGAEVGPLGEYTLSTVSAITGLLGGVGATCGNSPGCGPTK